MIVFRRFHYLFISLCIICGCNRKTEFSSMSVEGTQPTACNLLEDLSRLMVPAGYNTYDVDSLVLEQLITMDSLERLIVNNQGRPQKEVRTKVMLDFYMDTLRRNFIEQCPMITPDEVIAKLGQPTRIVRLNTNGLRIKYSFTYGKRECINCGDPFSHLFAGCDFQTFTFRAGKLDRVHGWVYP